MTPLPPATQGHRCSPQSQRQPRNRASRDREDSAREHSVLRYGKYPSRQSGLMTLARAPKGRVAGPRQHRLRHASQSRRTSATRTQGQPRILPQVVAQASQRSHRYRRDDSELRLKSPACPLASCSYSSPQSSQIPDAMHNEGRHPSRHLPRALWRLPPRIADDPRPLRHSCPPRRCHLGVASWPLLPVPILRSPCRSLFGRLYPIRARH